jgi:hypothetical protein
MAVIDGWCATFMDPIPSINAIVRPRPMTLIVLSLVPVLCPGQGGLAPLYRVSVTSIEGR